MIKRWLDNRMSKMQRDEAVRYLLMMKGADSQVIDLIAISTVLWAERYKARGTDLYDVAYWIHEEPMMALAITQAIKEVQKIEPGDANGLMVWLHTVRAAQWPELKLTARMIWKELERASADSGSRARELARGEGIDNPTCGVFPPIDFE